MKIRSVILAFVGLCLLATRIHAVDPSTRLTQLAHRIWQVQQGLPDATIYKILQTRDGYLWLGTQGGLVKFDGVKFTSVRSVGTTRLDSVAVIDLAEDADGGLIIATDGRGLLKMTKDQFDITTFNKGLASPRVDQIQIDDFKNIRISAGGSVFALNKGQFNSLLPSDAVTDRNYVVCSPDRDTTIFAQTASNIIVAQGGKISRQSLKSVPATATIQAICSNAEGLWYGTSAGLVLVHQDKEIRLTPANGLADMYVTTLLPGSRGILWIGTNNGFSRYYQDKISSYRAADGLSQSTVLTLYEDREGSLWVGTKHGLDQFMDGRTLPFSTSEGLPSNKIGPVLQDQSGNVWVGTLDAGLTRFDGQNFTRSWQQIPGQSITSLCEEPSGVLWIGSERGATRLSPDGDATTYDRSKGLAENSVTAIARDNDGTIWVGTPRGLARLKQDRFEQVGPDMLVHALIARRQGGVLVAGSGVIQLFQDDQRHTVARVDKVGTMYEDADGLLWIGTGGNGLYLLEDGQVSRLTMREGLFDNNIYSIVTDNRDRLWMVCSKGIFTVGRLELRFLAKGTIKFANISPITSTDSLHTAESQPGIFPGIQMMRDGSMWFSTIRGIVALNPDNLPRKLNPPPVAIDHVIVNGTEERPDQIVSLSPGNKNVEIHYTALSYIAAARMRFKYRLLGFDSEWTDAGTRREAHFTNLPPGRYKFQVIAANADGTWNADGTSVSFTLTPHFYQRKWFWWACTTVAVVIAWLFYLWRMHQVRRDLGLIAAERNRIARELHDTLIQGFSGVTMEMQALSVRIDNPTARAQMNDIIRDAGDCLREARHSVAGLRDTEAVRSSLTEELTRIARELTANHPIKLSLELARYTRRIPGQVEHHLIRIASEAIGNSIRHAQAKNITVRLENDETLLRLQIRDDGVGFDLDSDLPQGHFGLIGMRERATAIGASIIIDSEPGSGTLINVSLPLRRGSQPTESGKQETP